MQFFGKFGKITGWRPLLEGWRPLLRGILDPPLNSHQGFGQWLKLLTNLTNLTNFLSCNSGKTQMHCKFLKLRKTNVNLYYTPTEVVSIVLFCELISMKPLLIFDTCHLISYCFVTPAKYGEFTKVSSQR